jgi:hypothetical protein
MDVGWSYIIEVLLSKKTAASTNQSAGDPHQTLICARQTRGHQTDLSLVLYTFVEPSCTITDHSVQSVFYYLTTLLRFFFAAKRDRA